MSSTVVTLARKNVCMPHFPIDVPKRTAVFLYAIALMMVTINVNTSTNISLFRDTGTGFVTAACYL